MTDRKPAESVVVVGASAGGIEALRALLGKLPADLPAAVLVVLHLGSGSSSALTRILSRATDLSVVEARDGAALLNGEVTVAVPDLHLLVRGQQVRLGYGPRENGHRPAVDPLFRSAARWFDGRATAVVLSGALDDGAAGSFAVARLGGHVLVQDPAEAMYDGMPRAVLHVLPGATSVSLDELSGRIVSCVAEPGDRDPNAASGHRRLIAETDIAELDKEALLSEEPPGDPSGIACPDCHGVLFEIHDGELMTYRCRVGHAWSPESLDVQHSDDLETALWMALRVLEERGALHRKLAANARGSDRPRMEAMSEQRAVEADQSANVIRNVLVHFGAAVQPLT